MLRLEFPVIATPLRVLILSIALAVMMPLQAEAKSKPASLIHGTLIPNTQPVVGHTGNCYCEAQWYTAGLKPGKVTVIVHLMSIGLKLAASYGLRADLERRNHTILSQTQAGCWRTAKHCSLTLRFSAKVFRTAPYYIHVIGDGGEGMQFNIQVLGPVYRVS
jgi:hypothetical protein